MAGGQGFDTLPIRDAARGALRRDAHLAIDEGGTRLRIRGSAFPAPSPPPPGSADLPPPSRPPRRSLGSKGVRLSRSNSFRNESGCCRNSTKSNDTYGPHRLRAAGAHPPHVAILFDVERAEGRGCWAPPCGAVCAISGGPGRCQTAEQYGLGPFEIKRWGSARDRVCRAAPPPVSDRLIAPSERQLDMRPPQPTAARTGTRSRARGVETPSG